MCGSCRQGRYKYVGFKVHWDSDKWLSNPWRPQSDWNERPFIWIAFWRFDFLFQPFNNWRATKVSKRPWHYYRLVGPLEINYMPPYSGEGR